jgi:hypothetical protein
VRRRYPSRRIRVRGSERDGLAGRRFLPRVKGS